ncbi:MAG: hypothetical protein HY614_01400, partial [Candidatus Rokubacteria bacterium]|nr:hypothetical protein [Candidatus Rokubacteria bacterium]
VINRKKQQPGIDPFKAGIDARSPVGEYGGRPVYWDGKTEILLGGGGMRVLLLDESRDTLAKRLKESNLDNATINELLKRHNEPIALRDYLGQRVLLKKPALPGGKPKYEFMPDSLMYSLMLEFYNRTQGHDFVAMLPFISPPLKPIYQQANPDIRF